MSIIIASSAIRGAHEIAKQAQEILTKAIEQKGSDCKVEFPNTAYYLPIIHSMTGREVEKLSDLEEVMMGSKTFDDQIADGKAKFEGDRVVYEKLKRRMGIQTPTKIFDTMQILAELEPEVLERLHVDVVPLDAATARWAEQNPASEPAVKAVQHKQAGYCVCR